MNKLALLLSVLIVSGCTSSPPPPPEPEGEKTNINPPIVFLIDLYQDKEAM